MGLLEKILKIFIKIFIGIVGLFFLLLVILWFVGILPEGSELCRYTFMIPIDVKIERIDFPYKTESAFDNITVRYHNLPIGDWRYGSMIKYLFFTPSFYIEHYSDTPDLRYVKDVNNSSINLVQVIDSRAKDIKFGEFGKQVILISNKGKTEKIVTVNYYVPSDPLFIDKAIFYSRSTEKVEGFSKYHVKFDEVNKIFYIFERQPGVPDAIIRDNTTTYPQPVVYSSKSELRTVKYKIEVNIPFNPLRGYFHTVCTPLI